MSFLKVCLPHLLAHLHHFMASSFISWHFMADGLDCFLVSVPVAILVELMVQEIDSIQATTAGITAVSLSDHPNYFFG